MPKNEPQTSRFGEVFDTNFGLRSRKNRFEIGLKIHSLQEVTAQVPSTPDTPKGILRLVISTFDWRRAFIEGAREARRPKGPFGPFGGALRAPLGRALWGALRAPLEELSRSPDHSGFNAHQLRWGNVF